MLRLVRLVWWALAVAHIAHGLCLRRRRAAVTRLPEAEPKPAHEAIPPLTVLSAKGVEIDAVTAAAVVREMRLSGAAAVDLLPGDLSTEATLRLLNRVDPNRLRRDPLYAPSGANHAIAVHPSVAVRMGFRRTARAGLWRTIESPDRADLMRQARRVQRYAPTSTVMSVAPRLRAVPDHARDRRRELQELTADVKPLFIPAAAVTGTQVLHLLTLTAGPLAARIGGVAALAAWSSKPTLALGAAWYPSSMLRLRRAWAQVWEDAWAGYQEGRAAPAARRAGVTAYTAPPPMDDLFDRRRSTCPWCESSRLDGRLDVGDLLQHKPGSFHLDECLDCGHIFQNPALSTRGLEYYYDHFYDGGGAEPSERAFSKAATASNQGRIRAVAQFVEPAAWLDVGTGHGHFCLLARQRWPWARFDGLDSGMSVEEARRRGWIDDAYRGQFTQLADRLPHTYDVVSMHHYIEHTRDPRRELEAAAKVLRPGGYLIVEVPDTASPWSRLLGPYWMCWFQPQHQHFVTCENLVVALDDAGFETVSIERGPASTGGDLTFAPLLAARAVASNPSHPWVRGSSRTDDAKRLVAKSIAVPAAAVLLPVDRLRELYLRHLGTTAPSNAYRVVARKR